MGWIKSNSDGHWNLELEIFKWTENLDHLQLDESKKYWTSIRESKADLFLYLDKNNICQGVYCDCHGRGFNLFAGNKTLDWSDNLVTLLKKDTTFVTTAEISRNLNSTFSISQHGFVGRTTPLINKDTSNNELIFDFFSPENFDDVANFLKVHYPKLYLDLYYADNNFSLLNLFTNRLDKWGYLAYLKGEIVGYVSYFSSTIPLLGQKCAFVADLVIHKEMRGREYAYFLQSSAYKDLKNNSIDWVLGSIFPDNQASMNQAKKLGRSNLINLVQLI